MVKIEDIASKHLGKAGDGSVVKPYVTPDNIDPDLLVGVPRIYNRTQYKIEEADLPFSGADVWNGYEFSCLLDNGFPLSGQLRWVYSSDSDCIVESKSAKLYLNSFNMATMGKTIDEAISNVEEQVYNDLAPVLGIKHEMDLHVALHVNKGLEVAPIDDYFIPLEKYLDVTKIEFGHYNESPDILDVVKDTYGKPYRYTSNSLRSNCRVTNQPDWGDVFVHIKGDLTVTPESLLQYIVSMRKENHFHEEICECIYKRLYDLLDPEELMVTCLYTRRGGIDINPIRANKEELVYNQLFTDAYNLPRKTMRQ